MSKFHCLVMVPFSTIFSCFLLDSFELQEIVCLTKHRATFSSLNMSRHTYCSGYDEHTCDMIFFFLMVKLKNQSLKLIVITFCKKRLSCSCDGVINWGLTSMLVSTWLYSVNNCCLQFSNSRASLESLFL